MERNVESLLQRMRAAGDFLKGKKEIEIVTNYDADGISAGAIAAKALERAGGEVSMQWLRQLYPDLIEEIGNACKGKAVLFVDFGSTYIKEIVSVLGDEFVVIDHHQPGETDHPHHINPLLFGVDGGNEISSSGLCYLFAREMDAENKDLAGIAVVGACGDVQDRKGGLQGLNAEIVKEGVEAGVLSVRRDLALYGRISRPLAHYLCFATGPSLPGLTGNEESCNAFLHALDIPLMKGEKWRACEDLEEEERKKLVTALVMHLQKNGAPEWKVAQLMGDLYTLEKEALGSPLRDAKEFGTLLNACGRHEKSEVGHAVCLGEREEEYKEALALLAQHRRALRHGIEWVMEHGVEENTGFYWFDAGDTIADGIVGIVAGMLYSSGTVGYDKPIVALARYEDGSLKVSARGTQGLVREGMNLGKAMKEAAKDIEGAEGGGHAIAAGCKVPEEKREEFLKRLGAIIEGQLRESGA